MGESWKENKLEPGIKEKFENEYIKEKQVYEE